SSSPINNSTQQDTTPTMNIQSSIEPTTTTNVNAEENNDNQVEDPHTAKSKNNKEAMDDSAWIEAMQEELHQFDRLQVWELRDKPFGKNDEVYVVQPDGFVDPDHPEKVYLLSKALYRLKQASRAWYDKLSNFLMSKGFTKGQSIGTAMAMKPKLDADLSGKLIDQTDYRSKIGSLMYLTSSRPDIEVNMGLWYPKDSSFGLTSFLDADHAGCIDTRKSTSGGIQFLGDKLVSWMPKKQDCTAMSSAEAEYMALSTSFAQVMWMRTQLKDYGFNYNKIPLYCDSQSAIAISCNPVQHSRTKHIHTRYHFIKEQYLVRRIGMRCLTAAELEVLTNESV
ncbi:ribonuclease H-like domain-containing protein, partial [Tanacetum coccineum]